MFVALEVASAGSTGIFEKFFNIITRRKTQFSYRECLGASYGVITVMPDDPLKAATWRRIAKLAGRYGDRLLPPRGVEAPFPLSEPVFPRFECATLLKTAIELINLSNIPMYRRVAGLVDYAGEYTDFLFPLLHHYISVIVSTSRKELYAAESARIFEELGAPVTIAGEHASFDECALIIAPSDQTGTGFAGTKTPVLCLKAGDFGGLCISDLRSAAPAGLACPNGIEPRKFIAALYEFCGVEELAQPASQVLLGNSYASLAEAAFAVRQFAGFASVKY